MSASSDLQAALEGLLNMPAVLSVAVPVIARRPKERGNDIDAAADSNSGLSVQALPPLPKSALQGDDFVFFDRAEIRIRIIEQPSLNTLSADAYDLLDDVATGLHWQPHRGIEEAVAARMQAEPGESREDALVWVRAQPVNAPLVAMLAILSHPLQIAEHPADLVEDPRFRIIDVIFTAVYALNPTA